MHKNNLTDLLLRHKSIWIFLLLIAVANNNCAVVPVPAHSMKSEYGVIPEEIVQSIKLEKTTREDLVLLIGGPDRVYDGEKYFIYEWEVAEAVIAVPYGAGDVNKKHYFCIEFDSGNRIKRYIHITSGLIDSLYKNGSEAGVELYEWISNFKE